MKIFGKSIDTWTLMVMGTLDTQSFVSYVRKSGEI